MVINEIDRLREFTPLQSLLRHYAELGRADRQCWQDRRMQQEECTARDLTRLHGELMAYGWLEQNTGMVTSGKFGEVLACYRITPSGLRAMKRLVVVEDE